jgi:hypothetical protein
MYDARGTPFASPNHGGLTPAALVNVRLCIAKIAVPLADVRRLHKKSGGRQPPVGDRGTFFRVANIYPQWQTFVQS